jgi:hypothetical protein
MSVTCRYNSVLTTNLTKEGDVIEKCNNFFKTYCYIFNIIIICTGHHCEYIRGSVGGLQTWLLVWCQRAAISTTAQNIQGHQVRSLRGSMTQKIDVKSSVVMFEVYSTRGRFLNCLRSFGLLKSTEAL